jgi:hypothetical protein
LDDENSWHIYTGAIGILDKQSGSGRPGKGAPAFCFGGGGMETAKKRRPVKQPVAAKPLDADEGAGAVPEKPLRPAQCRTHLRKTVAAAYRDIVKGFVDQAKSGSCQHLKMATDVVESAKRVGAGSRKKGPAELMLEELNVEFPD